MHVISHGAGIFEKHTEDCVEWYKGDKFHREDGPAFYHFPSKWEVWYLNGERHRENGPAEINSDGEENRREWWRHGKLHREDGPAIEGRDNFKAWYIDGQRLSEKEFNIFLLQKQLQKEIPINNQHVKTKKTKI